MLRVGIQWLPALGAERLQRQRSGGRFALDGIPGPVPGHVTALQRVCPVTFFF